MSTKAPRIGSVGAYAGITALLVIPTLFAWFAKPQATAAQERRGAETPPVREATLTGRLIDLHCFMTEQYPTKDHERCTADCIRNGVPAALETPTGLVILGQGMTGPAKTLLPLAFQQVEARGKLYEKSGIKYLDVASVKKAHERPRLPEEPEEPEEPEDEPRP